MATITFQSESPSFKENLNQVSAVSLLITSLMTLANKGLFELTPRPSLTQAVSLSLTGATEEPGCSRQVEKLKFDRDKILAFSPDYNLVPW